MPWRLGFFLFWIGLRGPLGQSSISGLLGSHWVFRQAFVRTLGPFVKACRAFTKGLFYFLGFLAFFAEWCLHLYSRRKLLWKGLNNPCFRLNKRRIGAEIIAQWWSTRLVTERSWVWNPLGACLSSSLLFPISDGFWITSLTEVQHNWVSYKICCVQLNIRRLSKNNSNTLICMSRLDVEQMRVFNNLLLW